MRGHAEVPWLAEVLVPVLQARYTSGRDVAGVVPLHFEVRSSDGAVNDFSRFTATGADGSWNFSIPIASNEPSGTWTVRVTELIGGISTVESFSVEPVAPGARVIAPAPDLPTFALWSFDRDDPACEALWAGYEAQLRGRARFVEDGRSGGCLESFASVDDSAEGLEISRAPTIGRSGRFSVECWLEPKPEMVEANMSMLLDCNCYLRTHESAKANGGFALFPRRGTDGLRARVILGFGDRTVSFSAAPVQLEAGTWYHIGSAYDAAGAVTVYLDGTEIGGGKVAAGAIAPARHALIIGGRVGSTHTGCAAFTTRSDWLLSD